MAPSRSANAAPVTATPSEPWPDDWPVQQEDPADDELEQPCLSPGAALEACNGSDIYLAKAATVRSKKNPKYLVIMPGVWSFQKNGKNGSATAASAPGDNGDGPVPSTQDTEPPLSTTQESQDTTTVAAATTTTTTTTTTTAAAAAGSTQKTDSVVARLEHADSETPTLTVPLSQGQFMRLSGRKMHTTSKFLALTVQPKKGRVVCKSIFSSCLVFGQPELVGVQADAVSATASGVLAEQEEATVAATNVVLDHYGGSSRATDGCMHGNPVEKDVAKRSATKSKPKEDTSPVNMEKDGDDEEDYEKDQEEAPEKPVQTVDESSSGDEGEFKLKIDQEQMGKRKTPSRRLSKKTIKYSEMDQGSGEDDEQDDENEADESDGTKDSKAKRVRKAPAPRRKNSPVVSQTQEDDDDDGGDDDKNDDDGDDEAEEGAEDEPVAKEPVAKKRRQLRKPTKKIDAAKKTVKAAAATADSDEDEPAKSSSSNEDSSEDHGAHEDEPVAREPVAKKRRQSRKPTEKVEAAKKTVKVAAATADPDEDEPAKPLSSDEDNFEDHGAYQGELDDSEEDATGKRSPLPLRESQVDEVVAFVDVDGKEDEDENTNGADNRNETSASTEPVSNKKMIAANGGRSSETSARKRPSAGAFAESALDVTRATTLGVAPSTPVKSEAAIPPGSRTKRRRMTSPKKAAKKRSVVNLADDDFEFLG
jgi:hypothetical protein